MQQPAPDWSDKIDEEGTPVDPLYTNRSRNRVVNLFAHGAITSIPLRLRYVSIFCWAIEQLSDSEDDDEERYRQMKNIEKLFCLSSRYQEIQHDQPGAITGMDGNTEFNYDYEEFDEIRLDDLELLKNDSYAYQRFYENLLQKFLLKRGDFTLTAAGQELAGLVGERLGENQERIISCAESGRATRNNFEAFSHDFANQSVYYEAEFEPERRALQKVFLGFLEWEDDKQSGSVHLHGSIPEAIRINVLDHLHETLEMGDVEDHNASKLYQKYHRGYHHYRCAFSLFLLRARQLVMDDTANPIELKETDAKFDQFRSLMHTYWQQVYLGYALEAQLEATTTFLNSRIPARYDYEPLVESVSDADRIQAEVNGILRNFEVSDGSDDVPTEQLTRNLMLYGTADPTKPSVSITPADPETPLDLGTVQDAIAEWTAEGWETVPALTSAEGVNEVLLSKAIRNSLNGLHSALDDEDAQIAHWSRALACSTVLVLLEVARLRRQRDERQWLHNYVYSRLDSPFASLPALDRFIADLDPDTPIHEVARSLLREQVIGTHLRVFYDRLSPGNLKRMLSFDQDNRLCLEAQKERGEQPFRARVSLVRFFETNTFLRDCGLLEDDPDADFAVTPFAADLLRRALGGENA
ncbi:tetratricopeptide repeat protein [Salinigranum salinum]|uniref:tetratricopeptide repeat protein n=1 Tax=Salinigranum salinum TaxID=1364937 RepID=UPI0012611026|nr:tetratricopeptide repeat protein [Salinigranum salinum]